MNKIKVMVAPKIYIGFDELSPELEKASSVPCAVKSYLSIKSKGHYILFSTLRGLLTLFWLLTMSIHRNRSPLNVLSTPSKPTAKYLALTVDT